MSMKFISETRGLQRLREMRDEFAADIRRTYEHRAKPCAACETPGICCRDEHFVNVRITRLEAEAIVRRLDGLDEEKQTGIYARAREAVLKYGLAGGEQPFGKTYACPLFDKGTGCLVHDSAKPLPCIAHACYENEADLPPQEMLEERELQVGRLNRRVYGTEPELLPIPLAVVRRRSKEP